MGGLRRDAGLAGDDVEDRMVRSPTRWVAERAAENSGAVAAVHVKYYGS